MAKTKNGKALITAIKKNAVSERLVKAKGALEYIDNDGKTPLLIAVQEDNIEAVKLMLETKPGLININTDYLFSAAHNIECQKVHASLLLPPEQQPEDKRAIDKQLEMSNLLLSYKNFGLHYDDSSDDDDDIVGIGKLKLSEEYKKENDDQIIQNTQAQFTSSVDLKQSIPFLVMAHELGIKLIHSPKITDQYLHLKQKYLFNDKISKVKVEEVINDNTNDAREIVKNIKLGSSSEIPGLKDLDIQRKTLDKFFSYEISDDPFIELVSVGRLMTRSIKRDYANAQDDKNIFGNKSNPIKKLAREIKLPSSLDGTKISVLEYQELYETKGTRNDSVKIKTHNNSTKYYHISESINKIQESSKNITDQLIVKLIRNTLKGDHEPNDLLILPNEWKTKSKMDFAEFIGSLTYLLFGTEAVRNPASLIIHQMMLDLIENGNITFSSAFSHPSPIAQAKCETGGMMPMSQPGAVEACRLIHHSKLPTSMKYSYDKKNINETTAPANEYMAERILKLEENIINMWMTFKDIKDVEECYNAILARFQDWFGTTISDLNLLAQEQENFEQEQKGGNPNNVNRDKWCTALLNLAKEQKNSKQEQKGGSQSNDNGDEWYKVLCTIDNIKDKQKIENTKAALAAALNDLLSNQQLTKQLQLITNLDNLDQKETSEDSSQEETLNAQILDTYFNATDTLSFIELLSGNS